PSDLCIARANAVKGVPFATDKDVAVRVDVERSIYRTLRDNDRCLPGDAAVGGTLEFHTAPATVSSVVRLVLEAVPRPSSLIDGQPLLIASSCPSVRRPFHPGLAAVCRAPKVVTEKREVLVRLETEI